ARWQQQPRALPSERNQRQPVAAHVQAPQEVSQRPFSLGQAIVSHAPARIDQRHSKRPWGGLESLDAQVASCDPQPFAGLPAAQALPRQRGTNGGAEGNRPRAARRRNGRQRTTSARRVRWLPAWPALDEGRKRGSSHGDEALQRRVLSEAAVLGRWLHAFWFAAERGGIGGRLLLAAWSRIGPRAGVFAGRAGGCGS